MIHNTKTKKYLQTQISVTCALLISLVSITTYAEQSVDERLESITESVEQLRQELHIPGIALAIIKDDKVILAKGFGFRDVEGKILVTPETNFAIGSTSKAFTATLVGMLNDQGKLSWDDKITQYIEWYKPNLNDETGNLTIRDMLSHRSGLARNDILWVNGKVGREAILKESLDAEPLDDFREKFNYNNVLFLASGMASADVAGESDWDSLLDKRLLTPLQMKSTTSRNDKATNMAFGYRWNEHDAVYERLDKKNLDNISPAGGIHSNALDMAQWVRFNLNKGTYEGKRLLSEEQFNQIWSPSISITQGMDYGLGWFLRDWKGRKVIEHGGNIQGFAAQVALMPEENLGFVLLTNVTATPLQQGSMEVIWEGLLGDEAEAKTPASENDLSQYVGKYVANFGPFKDTSFTVQVKDDGTLAVDVPGQQLYALNSPDESGKWYFKLTNTIAVSFSDIENNKANLMKMHQSGMDFELPREGVVLKAEVDLAEFSALLGDYSHPKLPRPMKALIQNNRLAIDVPGQMIYELHLPNEDGYRNFRINSALSAKFNTTDNGKIASLSVYKDKNEQLTAKRVETTNDSKETLPTVAEILKLMKTEEKLAVYKASGGVSISAKATMLQAGVTGKMSINYEGTDRFSQFFDFGDYGTITTVLNGNFAATKGIQPYTEFKGVMLEQVKNDHPISAIDWLSHYDSMKVTEKRIVDDRAVYLVELREKDLPLSTIAVDVETGDVIKRRGGLIIQDIGTIPIVITYSDFRTFNGIRAPYKAKFFNPMNGNILIEYESIEINKQFDESAFTLTK